MQKALEGLKEGKVPEGDYTFDSIKKVVGFPEYFEELEQLDKNGVDYSGRLFVSDRATLVSNVHREADRVAEERKGS